MRLAALLVVVGFLGTVPACSRARLGGGPRSRGGGALALPSARPLAPSWPLDLTGGATLPLPPHRAWVPSAGSTNSTSSRALRVGFP